MKIGYRRVSTLVQSTERQLDGLTLDRVFEDKVSGKDLDRPKLKEALAFARSGDTLVVHSMDRLARNLRDLLSLVDELNKKKIAVQFIKENLTFTGEDSPSSKLFLQMLGSFAEFERSMILERQREGIAIAKAKGVYRGRKRKLNPLQVSQLKDRAAKGEESKAELAREYGISRQSLYAYLEP
ncbi:MAG: recombinase family protein [Terriglobales bacterium]|jgi:DNA invertase Pin-like site-specific DNA recombinase